MRTEPDALLSAVCRGSDRHPWRSGWNIQTIKNTDITNINKDIDSLEKKDKNFEERITILENYDITPITDKITLLEEKDTFIDEEISKINDETLNIRGILSDLKEEVEENELVHSAGLITLNQGLNDLREVVEKIEGGDIVVDLTEIEGRVGDVEKDIDNLEGRVKSIEDGNLNVDLTEIEGRIGDVETLVNDTKTIAEEGKTLAETNKTDIDALKQTDIDYNTRIENLENAEPIDLTEIEGNISKLEGNLTTIETTANKALSAANESVKNIIGDEDDYISITTSKNGRDVNIKIDTNIVSYKDASEELDGLATTLDIKNEVNEIKSIIDSYRINGKIVSENPEINTDDLNIGGDYLTKKPNDSQSVMPNDELTLALAKIEKKMDIALEVLTAALNDLNNRIKLLEENN